MMHPAVVTDFSQPPRYTATPDLPTPTIREAPPSRPRHRRAQRRQDEKALAEADGLHERIVMDGTDPARTDLKGTANGRDRGLAPGGERVEG